MSHSPTDPVPHLSALPATFAATVASLHRVAERIVSPARKPDDKISLQSTAGGFGTPEFEFGGARHQVRVAGAELVHRSGGEERRVALTTLAGAQPIVAELLPPNVDVDDDPLDVDPAAAQALADWYAFGDAILEQLIARARPVDAPTPVKLFPEHFDIAIELGPEERGLRANYGLSPGDEQHAEPYAYVGPWTAEVTGPLWQATGFRGAELTYAELLAATDQRATALDFFRTRTDALATTARSSE